MMDNACGLSGAHLLGQVLEGRPISYARTASAVPDGVLAGKRDAWCTIGNGTSGVKERVQEGERGGKKIANCS